MDTGIGEQRGQINLKKPGLNGFGEAKSRRPVPGPMHLIYILSLNLRKEFGSFV